MTSRNVDAVSSITKPEIPIREELREVETSSSAPVKSALESLEWRLSLDGIRGVVLMRFGVEAGGRERRLVR